MRDTDADTLPLTSYLPIYVNLRIPVARSAIRNVCTVMTSHSQKLWVIGMDSAIPPPCLHVDVIELVLKVLCICPSTEWLFVRPEACQTPWPVVAYVESPSLLSAWRDHTVPGASNSCWAKRGESIQGDNTYSFRGSQKCSWIITSSESCDRGVEITDDFFVLETFLYLTWIYLSSSSSSLTT